MLYIASRGFRAASSHERLVVVAKGGDASGEPVVTAKRVLYLGVPPGGHVAVGDLCGNQDVVDVEDEVLAFQINASRSIQNTVNRARLKEIPVMEFTCRTK